MRNSKQRKSGFSLIELLVVISVIVVLTTITVRLWSNVSQKVAVNATIEKLENVDHWLEEYYAIYGYYPKTSNFTWEDPTQSSGKPDDWDLILDKAPQLGQYGTEGLCYWITKKVPESSHAARFEDYKRKIGVSSGSPDHTVDSEDLGFEYGEINYTNQIYSVSDAWNVTLYYQVSPDLQSYRTWSAGPDTKTGNPADNADDISRDNFTE